MHNARRARFSSLVAGTARFGLALIPWLANGCADTVSEGELETDAEVTDAGMQDDSGRDASGPVPVVGDDYLAFEPLKVSASGVLDLSFDLPTGARSFVLSARAAQRGHVLLLRLVHADGSVLFDREMPEVSPFRPVLADNLELSLPLAVSYPSAAGNPALVAGRYRVQLGFVPEATGLPPVELGVDLVWQTRAEPTSLPINIWLARGASETAESVIANDLYLDAFAKLREIFEPAGIALDPLQAFDLGPEGAALGEIASDEDLDGLLKELEKTPASGLDFILVDRIVATGKTVRGKSTGIPGPPAHPRLPRRGAVVLAMDSLPVDPLRIAEAFAHEATHYLGLRHTTELDASEHDPIADTPECPIELASYETTSGELLLSPPDCQDYDGSNLLFPMPPFDTKPQHDLSPEQIDVLRASPLLR